VHALHSCDEYLHKSCSRATWTYRSHNDLVRKTAANFGQSLIIWIFEYVVLVHVWFTVRFPKLPGLCWRHCKALYLSARILLLHYSMRLQCPISTTHMVWETTTWARQNWFGHQILPCALAKLTDDLCHQVFFLTSVFKYPMPATQLLSLAACRRSSLPK